MLTDDALDRRAQEGRLAAAAANGDATQLADAWQQVCACLDGDIDVELRELYEPRRELERVSNASNDSIGEIVGSAPLLVVACGHSLSY